MKGKRPKRDLDLINNHWLDVPVKMTPTSLTLPKGLSYERWAEIGPRIVGIRKFCTWALADWLNYGERKYGETYTQAVDATRCQPDYLAIIKYVGSAVEPSRRRENLSFTHHRLVASLEPKDQERFLSDAENNDWSQDELREAVRVFKSQIEAPEEEPTTPTDGKSDESEDETECEKTAEDFTEERPHLSRAECIALVESLWKPLIALIMS